MEIQDLILADYAAANEGGKFTLVGAGFSKISARQFPCIHPVMFILVRAKITLRDKGKNRIEMTIIGERGKIFGAGCDVNVPETQIEEEYAVLPIQLVNLKFDLPGPYNVEVFVNGELKASHPLTIVDCRPSGPDLER
ncbi:MAG: hypothetical protein HQL23_05430 [Candidatus Omnitrophica bacterium]|nr:hypothetical protein [Candidatus Omnitrophota bacterium]